MEVTEEKPIITEAK